MYMTKPVLKWVGGKERQIPFHNITVSMNAENREVIHVN